MIPGFWLENWHRGQIGFHLSGVNPYLSPWGGRMTEIFDGHYKRSKIETQEVLDDNPGLTARGWKKFTESVCMLSPKPTS